MEPNSAAFALLFQAKLRLEMEMERLRQTHSKEIESKDDEVEEIRQSCSKKVSRSMCRLMCVFKHICPLSLSLLGASELCGDLRSSQTLISNTVLTSIVA